MSFKILCVDDESDMEILIKQKFRKQIKSGEYDFYFAINGQEALDVIGKNSDLYLVLADINMPVMDGLTLLSKINDMHNPLIKVVMVSAYGDMQNIRTAMNRGAFDFVNKPIDFDDFTATVEKSKSQIVFLLEKLKQEKLLESVELDLTSAAKIQSSLLPKLNGPLKENKDLIIGSFIRPAKWGGGDFYDVFQIDEDNYGFIIADVSGKGLPAAAFMFLSRTAVKIFSNLYSLPSEVVNAANNYLNIDNYNSMFVTLLYGVYNAKSHNFTYCNAGHNPPYMIKGGQVEILKPTNNMALGIIENLDYHDASIVINPTDKLFMFTDGVSECMNESDTEFEEEGIIDFLEKNNSLGIVDLVSTMVTELRTFQGDAEQHDDITILGLEIS